MDMNTGTVRLPGEIAAAPPETSLPSKPPLLSRMRGVAAAISPRTKLLAGTALVGVVGIGFLAVAVAMLPANTIQAPRPAIQMASTGARLEATPPSMPIPAPEPPGARLADLPAETPRTPSPQPVAAPAPAGPDPLAEQSRLLQEATAPIPALAAAPPSDEVASLSAMVTRLSAMLAESLRGQVEIRNRVMDIEKRQASVVLDQNRRLAYLEAQASESATQRAAAPAVPPPPAAPAPRLPAPRSANAATTYRITGASPNLAYLVPVNPAAGDPSSLTVKAGTQIPGYGTVRSIEQRGTAWVISTERGEITSN